jgi:hypothetical protein
MANRAGANFELSYGCEREIMFRFYLKRFFPTDIYSVIFHKINCVNKHGVVVGHDLSGLDYKYTRKYIGDFAKYGECKKCMPIKCVSRLCCSAQHCNMYNVYCIRCNREHHPAKPRAFIYTKQHNLVICCLSQKNLSCKLQGAFHCVKCFPVCNRCDDPLQSKTCLTHCELCGIIHCRIYDKCDTMRKKLEILKKKHINREIAAKLKGNTYCAPSHYKTFYMRLIWRHCISRDVSMLNI